MNSAKRIAHRLLLKETPKRAIPTVVTEKTIVLLCVSRDDKKPAPSREVKYPTEMMRKNDPASAWLIPKSFSIVGIKGASIILAMKLRKKMQVNKRIGPSSDLIDLLRSLFCLLM